MECYYIAKRKPIRHEEPKLQTATVVSLWFCGFVVFLHVLNFIVIGLYTINIPGIFQPFTVF